MAVGGMRLVAVGGLIGLILAFLGAQLLGGLLFGVETTDPTVLGLVPIVLAAVAFLTAWIPARRAGRIDPVRIRPSALRSGRGAPRSP